MARDIVKSCGERLGDEIKPTTVESVKTFIETHYSDAAMSLSSIARELMLSSTYLSHLFKKTTGISLLYYINDVRLANAKRMLVETSAPIADIALRCGYYDGQALYSVFKRHESMSPSEYRKKNRK